MSKRIEDFKVIENKRVSADSFIIDLLGYSVLPEIKPGQFVQVRVDGSPETFLRRPISVYDVDYKRNIIRLLIQIVGKGTEALSRLKKDDNLNLVYPLGNWFAFPGQTERILLIGGGVGIAPMYFLGKHLKSAGYSPDILLGFRNSERIIEHAEFNKIGNVYLTTEDGSEGEKGFVTNHSVLLNARYDRVYCCGPDPMMEAVAGYCKNKGIECEVSLEKLMACGIGICLCCIVETVKGNLCTCTEGPVFNINDLKW